MAGLSVWPLARLFFEAFAPDDTGRPLGLMAEVLSARSTGGALANTLAASAGSVAISLALGMVPALVTGLFALRGRLAMTWPILSPLLVPSQTLAPACIEMSGVGSPILRLIGLASSPGATNWQADGPWVVPGTVVALAMLLTFVQPLPLMARSTAQGRSCWRPVWRGSCRWCCARLWPPVRRWRPRWTRRASGRRGGGWRRS